MIPLTLSLACGPVLYYIFQYIYRRSSRRHEAKSLGCEPIVKYPHLDPLWGLDLSVQLWRESHRGELSEGMRRRHEKFGHTFNTKNLGQACVYTIDPDNIRAVTADNFEDYGKSGWVQEGSKHVGSGILMNDGEAWKQSRATLKGIFARTAIDEPTLVEPHFQQLAEVIRGNRGRPFNFQEVAARFTLDLVTDFLFGKSTETLPGGKDADEANYFLSLIKNFEPSAGTFIAVGALAWFELLPSYQQIIEVVNGMKGFFRAQLDFIISDSERPTRLAGPSCFRMMEHEGVDIGQIQAELQNIFFASFDTTTGLVSNIIDILSRRQDVQLMLREEISHLKGNPPTRQDLGKMDYLRLVFLESLRLYSPVASHSRQAIKNTTLPRGGGSDGRAPVFIAAGTTIVWSTYSLNRYSKYYGDDWAEFRPQRWRELQATSSKFFMPFGSGPRICMGQQMAQTEISYTIVRLLQEFVTIEIKDDRPFKEARAVSFYNAYGTMVSIY